MILISVSGLLKKTNYASVWLLYIFHLGGKPTGEEPIGLQL